MDRESFDAKQVGAMPAASNQYFRKRKVRDHSAGNLAASRWYRLREGVSGGIQQAHTESLCKMGGRVRG